MEKPPLPAIMHLESVTAAEVAKDVQAVDANEAKVIHQTLDSSQQGGYTPITAEEKAQHRNLNRKLDLFLVPFCALIYVFNGLDRSNLGNAQTDEFTNDLGMPTSAINTATSLFFATYVPLQPFSASIGKKVGQTYWLGIIGVGWGVLTLGHAFIKTESQLIAIRLVELVTDVELVLPTVLVDEVTGFDVVAVNMQEQPELNFDGDALQGDRKVGNPVVAV